MIITQVHVKNYRSLRDITLDVGDYSALAGANGAGKSSVLYALDWFFNGRALSATDVSGYVEGVTPQEECFIEVAVTFRDLTANDRRLLREYGRGSTATFRRTWRLGDGDKVVGNALQGPGFAAVRKMTRVSEVRPAYAALREELDGLPDLGATPSKDDVHDALEEWESETRNQQRLVTVADDEANHMFGINGPNVIKECVRLVLIPAATDISTQVGNASDKKSALNTLIGAVMAEAGALATSAWARENQEMIDTLQTRVRDSIETSTKLQAKRVNSRLTTLIPNAQLSLTPLIPEWTPKTSPAIRTDVTIDGVTNDISRQGQGIQRAVMMSMFEALVPNEESARDAHAPGSLENQEEASRRLEKELEQLPVLIVCIEEPEIYQHPIRARTFARTLTELSEQTSAQVLIATHSPYFIRPKQFASLHRFTLTEGLTGVASTSVSDLESRTGVTEAKFAKIIEKNVPTNFSEGFFADSIVLVEGETDRAVVETLAARIGLDLDARGVSLIDVSSKTGLHLPYEIFTALNIPTYVVADADSLGARRRYPEDAAKREEAHKSHVDASTKLMTWAPGEDGEPGSETYADGAPTLTTKYLTLWHDDLEHELESWPSFMTALTEQGKAIRCKDLHAYRTAVEAASMEDLPLNITRAMEAISSFRIARSEV